MRSSAFAAADRGTGDLDIDLLGLTSLGGGQSSHAAYTGIKALMVAVLDNGISCYMNPTPRSRAEAEYWVNARSRSSPFSFTVVCETLRLEPDAVRTALARLRAQDGAPVRAITRRRQNVRRPGPLLARSAG